MKTIQLANGKTALINVNNVNYIEETGNNISVLHFIGEQIEVPLNITEVAELLK